MNSIRTHVVRGFGWVLGITVVGRLIQLVALAITTRLLTEQDFGMLAVVTAAILLLERLTTFGLDAALIQSREINTSMLNVAWSYQFVRNLVLGMATFGAAPWLASAFHEPASTDLIQVAALAFPITGLRNIGLVELRRRMDFRRLGYCDLVPATAHAVASVALTLVLKDVWALVYATLVMAAVGTLVSYQYSPHRPRFEFRWSTARPLFGFGLCLLGNTFLQTLREQGVVLLLTRSVTTETLGVYNRAVAFSFNLFVQAQAMYWRVMFPALASLQTRPDQIRSVWRRMTLLAATVAVPVLIVFTLTVPTAVRWVLGENWVPMVSTMQWFGVHAALLAVSSPSEVLFQAVGRPILGTRLQVLNTMILALLIGPGMQWLGLAGVALAFAVAAALVTPLTLWMAHRLTRPR